jgi:hypothetical protein
MIGPVLEELTRFFSREALTVADVALHIGPVTADHGDLMPLDLRPIVPGVKAAQLWRYPDTGLPYLLKLEPTADSAPRVSELKASLGKPKRARTDLEAPPAVLFRPAMPEGSWTVIVITELEPGGDELEEATVRSIALRRDPPDTSERDRRKVGGSPDA